MGCACAAVGQTWQPVWNDEFNGTSIDASRWRFELGGGGWGNNEIQTYTDSTRNATVWGPYPITAKFKRPPTGTLAIVGRRDAAGGFSSARLASRAAWTYGKVEIRALVPGGVGTWPAIWMLPAAGSYGNLAWPDNGEIDIMEEVGHEGDVAHCSVHTHTYNWMNGNGPTNGWNLANMVGGWHLYSLEWFPDHVDIKADGGTVLTWRREGRDWRAWPFDRPFELRLNMAIGGNWGGAQGVTTTGWPRGFLIDYVRVYRAATSPYLPRTAPGTAQATDYDQGGQGFSFYDSTPANEGGLGSRVDAVDVGTSPTEGLYIGWIAPDEWWTYTFDVPQAGSYTLNLRTAAPAAGARLTADVDDQKFLPSVDVAPTGSWDTFGTTSAGTLSLTAGVHRVRVRALSAGWNLSRVSLDVAPRARRAHPAR